MKVCVFGSDGRCVTIAGILAEGGAEVTLAAPRVDFVDAVNADGLVLREGRADRAVRLRAATNTVGLGAADVLILSVDAAHVADAVESAGSVLGRETLAAVPGRSPESLEALARVVGAERTFGLWTNIYGRIAAPGRVEAEIGGGRVLLGMYDGGDDPRLRRFVDLLRPADLDVEVCGGIVDALWDELLAELSNGAICALTGLSYGLLYQQPELTACARAAVAEGVAVARAVGARLASENADEIRRRASAGLPGDYRPRMLRDVENGEPCGVADVNGYIVRCGEANGIPTPVNRTLLACLMGLERGRGLPG